MENQFPRADESSKEEKQKALLERARKGVLKFLGEKGGKLTLGDLHDYSMSRYLIQHQSFSRMMETYVDERLVDYNDHTQDVILTEAGRQFITTP